MPRVNVILPTYNCSRYIAQAIESVLASTYQDYELIIVDDGSTDATQAVVTRYVTAHPRKIRYIYQENAGEGGARNRGIRESTGDYIAFLDSDDVWVPEKLQLQMNLIDSMQEKDIVVHGNAFTFNDSGTITESVFRTRTPYAGYVYKHLLYENFVITQTVIAKKSILEKVGCFKTNLPFCADFEMWLRLSKNYPFYHVRDVIAGYRMHPHQISSNIRRMRDYHIEIVRTELTGIANHGKNNRILAKQYFDYGYIYWRNNLIPESRAELLLSLKHRFLMKTFSYYLVTFFPEKLVETIRLLRAHARRSCKKGRL